MASQLQRLQWSRARQWQWVEDYCYWLEDGCSPLQAAEAMHLSAVEYGLSLEQQMADRLYQCLRSGQPISFALKGWLNANLLQVFSLGQQNDCLIELLQQFKQFEQRRYRLVMSLWKQRLYPLFILGLVLLATLVAGQSYLPRLLSYSTSASHDWSVTLLLMLSDFMLKWGLLVLAGLTASLIIYGWLARNWISAFRFKLERLGLFGYYRAMSAVWVTQMVALLLRHRLSLQECLHRLQPLSTGYIRCHLQQMNSRLACGERQLARVMETGLLTPQLLFRLHNSGQRGVAADGLWRTALRSDRSIRRELMRRQRLALTGIYLIIVGLLVLLIQAAGKVMMQLLGA